MALIFPRVAQNFIKNGYFPTDEVTLTRLIQALDVDASRLRLLDPCCGEGVALAEIAHHLQSCGATTEALGVEFDHERAWHAKRLLAKVAHADVADVFVTPRSIGLLFLNPPYGHTVADRAGTGDSKSSDRLEKVFFRRTQSWLQFGGVLVLIIPHTVLDTEFATLIARNFERVSVFMAPDQTFKQCVIFGVKRRSDSPDARIVAALTQVGQGERPPTLPEVWHEAPYVVPGATDEATFHFRAVRIDAEQLGAELANYQRHTLWPQFSGLFASVARPHRRPLRPLSQWHLALALAAGQISGVVTADDGRTVLIKGDTFKEKDVKVDLQTLDSGAVLETRVATDKFVPVIRGIDLTPGASFGNIITIR